MGTVSKSQAFGIEVVMHEAEGASGKQVRGGIDIAGILGA
jgi:hypothetical protein